MDGFDGARLQYCRVGELVAETGKWIWIGRVVGRRLGQSEVLVSGSYSSTFLVVPLHHISFFLSPAKQNGLA